jgi:hypothetical protein
MLTLKVHDFGNMISDGKHIRSSPMLGIDERTAALEFIVSSLQDGHDFASVDAAVGSMFPQLEGPALFQTYRLARDRLARTGSRYPYRRRSDLPRTRWCRDDD